MGDISIIQRRRIEANVIKPIFDEMVASLGEGRARAILESAIVKDAVAHGRDCAPITDIIRSA